ncbi:MAG: glycosyltransferase [Bacteroidia bacterium]
MSDRKRILVFIDWYLPGFKGGGPITSIANMVAALKDEFDFWIVTSDRDAGESKPYPGIATETWLDGDGCKVWYFSKAGLSYAAVRRLIGETDYDLLYLNSMFSVGFTIYPLWGGRAAKPDVPILLAPRGMLHLGALALKPLKKKIFLGLIRALGIQKHIHFHATDSVEVEDIRRVFGKETKVTEAPNLPQPWQAEWVDLPKSPGTLRLVYLSRLSEKKGLHLVLEWLRDLKGEVSLEVVGPDDEPGYGDRCRKLIAALPSNIQVTEMGALPQNEGLSRLRAAHAFVMPTMGENFGHAIFEALNAGRPVLISDQTPWRDLVEARAGWDIPLADAGKFREALEQLVMMDHPTWESWARAAHFLAKQYLDRAGQAGHSQQMFDRLVTEAEENRRMNS